MQDIKLECLKLAVSLTGTTKEALAVAKQMYEFVSQ